MGYMLLFPSGIWRQHPCMMGSPEAQQVKIPPAVQEPQETWVQFLGWEDPLEEEMATCSSILAWRIPWTEEPGGLQSMWSQRVRHNWLNTHSTALHDSDAFYMKLANHPSSTKLGNSLLESGWSLADGGQRHGSLCWVPWSSVLPMLMPWCPGRLFYSPRYLFWHHQAWTASEAPGPRQLTRPSPFSGTVPWMLPGDRNQMPFWTLLALFCGPSRPMTSPLLRCLAVGAAWDDYTCVCWQATQRISKRDCSPLSYQ